MNQSNYNEVWKDIQFGKEKVKLSYKISNYGRIMSFTKNSKDGHVLKESFVNGYPMFRVTISGKLKTLYIHKYVGEYFLSKESEDQTSVIHLDHNIKNNHVNNLKWATRKEMAEHAQKSPAVIAARERVKNNPRFEGHKLNSTQVMLIKKKIFDPNRKTRLKMIAKQFGISEMQLYRIKSGENWGHVKVDIKEKKKDLKK